MKKLNEELKHNSKIFVFSVLSVLLFSGSFGIYLQDAYAVVTTVTINSPTTGQSFGAGFSINYDVADDGVNTATAGSITFTRTGGSADANSPHTYTMVAGDWTTGNHVITRTTLETGFGNSLVDGTVYTIVVSITDGGAITDTETSVTADFTAPSFTAALTASNQITLTWNENIISTANAAVANNPFTLGGTAVTVASTSDISTATSTQVLTLSGNIPDGSSITISYDADAGNGDIQDTANVSPNSAPDRNNIAVSGVPAAVQNNGGSSASKSFTKPSFGFNEMTGKAIMENNICVGNQCYTDSADWHVETELFTVATGDEIPFSMNIPTQRPLKMVETFFGIDKVGDLNSAVTTAILKLDWKTGNVDEVMMQGNKDAIVIKNIEAERKNCADLSAKCSTVAFDAEVMQAMEGKVLAQRVTDLEGYTNMRFYNDGVETKGDSKLDQPKISAFDNAGRLYDIILDDKSFLDQTKGHDIYGNVWIKNQVHWYMQAKSPVPVSDNYRERHGSAFKTMMGSHYNDIMNLRNSIYPTYTEEPFADLEDPITIDYPEIRHRELTLAKLPWYYN